MVSLDKKDAEPQLGPTLWEAHSAQHSNPDGQVMDPKPPIRHHQVLGLDADNITLEY
jgi:hypothetical protein